MCASALSFLDNEADPEDYLGAMLTMSFCGGSILLLLGVLRMGWITSILSETVITSFTAASAINIGASQLKHFWGVSCNKDSFLHIVMDIFSKEKVWLLMSVKEDDYE